MLYGLFVSIYVFLCFLMVTLVLVQPSKSSAGVGDFSGGSQMLFGGSGGQDFLQKTTWVLGALIMLSSLSLSLWKASNQQGTLQHRTPQQQEHKQ